MGDVNETKKLWNIPNALTVFRVILIPAFIYFLLQPDSNSRLLALFLFILASITDFFDGYLARKWNQESAFGRFLDPLADKALVISAIVLFVVLDPQIPAWMVIVIVARDILITLLRWLAIRKGMEVKTSKFGKLKTAFQMFSIVLILVIFAVRSYRHEIIHTYTQEKMRGQKNIEIALNRFQKWILLLPKDQSDPHEKKKVFAESVPYILMLITTIFTAISGIRYLVTNYQILLPKKNE
ncbi:MAG: CDP-diacylglycerol--glycerol-3-phosphate 3-phosphatidyltransferase [Candidatus Hydrogenedentota bacterium]|nr:MAG: CDP-diacylglycerol--glycerol-3-phosphate 3-phosphatidyltransferase [Candidatus Hydrogenedentota bacterium]